MVMTQFKTNVHSSEDVYPYLLAVGSDTLLILDHKQELVEWIIKGTTKEAWVCSSPDEDTFLENLSLLKACILSGRNPFDVYEFLT